MSGVVDANGEAKATFFFTVENEPITSSRLRYRSKTSLQASQPVVTLRPSKNLRPKQERFIHIAMVLMGGIVQLAIFVLFGWLWGHSAAAMAFAARIFIPFWLVVAAVNMWVGVTHAGYTLKAESPIFLLNFLVPAAVAWLTAWQLTRA